MISDHRVGALSEVYLYHEDSGGISRCIFLLEMAQIS